MDLISKLEDLKNFGIDLKLDSKEMEVFYVRSMKYFFDEKEHVYLLQISINLQLHYIERCMENLR
jgi:hypothetical protein